MMVVYSKICTGQNAQFAGAAKMMVTVVAIEELEAGDVLRRFGAEAARDTPRSGKNDNQCILARLLVVSVWKFSHAIYLLLCVVFIFLFSL